MRVYKSKNEVNEQLGRKTNQGVNVNRKQFWKEMDKMNNGRLENCTRIKKKNGTGRQAVEEDEVLKTQF